MIVAGFASPEDLAHAARALREAGIDAETRSPVALPEDEAAGSRLPLLVLGAGIAGALLGFGMQCYATMVGYRLIIGARPDFFWPSFLVYAFECGVLAATLTAFVGFLASNRLPRLYEPADESDALREATRDGYFVVAPDRKDARDLLRSLRPVVMERAP